MVEEDADQHLQDFAVELEGEVVGQDQLVNIKKQTGHGIPK